MNQTAPVTDNTQETKELEEFLVWFCQQEEIPAVQRHALMQRVLEVGGLDEAAMEFIDESMEIIEKSKAAKVDELEAKAALIQGCLIAEANPENSAKHNIAKKAGEYMLDTASEAIEQGKAAQQEQADAVEAQEHETDEHTVEELKKQL